MTVISTISSVKRDRPRRSSTRWPMNQKKTIVSSTQICEGELAIGQVTMRHSSPWRTSGE